MSSIVVSIIIPVYNSEQYLRKCLESIINQSYSRLEIILVNDGSTDSSGEIIDDYSARDNRIIAIHKENGGIGSAYKVAFKVMNGEYILFVDSDDWLEPNTVYEVVTLAMENSVDIASFGIRAFNKEGVGAEIQSFKNIDYLSSSNEEILKLHFDTLRHPTLARLYRKELFDDIVIFEQNIGIDEMLTPQLLLKCNKAVYVSKVLYNALVRDESVCRAGLNEKKIRDTMKVYQFLGDFMEKNIPDYAPYINDKYLDALANMYKFSLRKHNRIDQTTAVLIKREFLNAYKKARMSFLYHAKSIKFRISVGLLIFVPFLYSFPKVARKN